MTDSQIKIHVAELNAAQKEFFALWNEKKKSDLHSAVMQNYSVEALCWQFYLHGRRAIKTTKEANEAVH